LELVAQPSINTLYIKRPIMSGASLEERRQMLLAYRQTGAFASELKATLPPPTAPPAYAFTEIRTFRVAENSVIENDATDEGKIWAHTIRTHLEDEGTGLVWWGRLVESPQVVKLVIGRFCTFFRSEFDI
jgi:hypothetical protein